MFLDTDDLHPVEVDHGANAFQRAGVTVVGGIAAQEAEGAGQPQCPVLLRSIVPGRPDIDHHQRRIDITGVAAQGLTEQRTPQHRLFAFDLLVDRHGRLHAGQ